MTFTQQSELANKIHSLSNIMVDTKDIFERDANARIETSITFYRSFFKDLIFYLGFDEEEIRGIWSSFFGNKDRIKFLAVDGTSFACKGKNFVTFFGGSFGVMGYLSKEILVYPDPSKFERTEGIVAYVPTPYSEIIIEGENIEELPADNMERIDLSAVHNKVMRLAELYLVYKLIRGEDYPEYVLIDGSISGLQMTLTRSFKTLKLNLKIGDRELRKEDLDQVHIRPFNLDMKQPSPVRKWNRSFDEKLWQSLKEKMVNRCKLLFDDNNSSALYEIYQEKDVTKHKWLTSDDYDFLSLIALYAIVEECWKKNILLTSVSKDSGVSYMTKKYLKVCKFLGESPYSTLDRIPPIMWTDALYFDAISDAVTLTTPWSTIEYDSVFATLQIGEDVGTGKEYLTGIRNQYLSPDRLFVKSYAQFYRFSEEGMGSDIVAIDRLVYPEDLRSIKRTTINIAGKESDMQFEFVFFRDRDSENQLQRLNAYLLHKLCLNKNMEAFGYPHPLFMADKLAKNLLEMVKPMIHCGNDVFFRHPKHWTMRQRRTIVESVRR
ncbi:MAG: DNA double-strand break repair nuclease NurA [Theionarchaea archaeon]|nr:DNA double-strand break repair nuclease NurA [Theionarchaea archaeon]